VAPEMGPFFLSENVVRTGENAHLPSTPGFKQVITRGSVSLVKLVYLFLFL
jgi:hypothetical protein